MAEDCVGKVQDCVCVKVQDAVWEASEAFMRLDSATTGNNGGFCNNSCLSRDRKNIERNPDERMNF